MRTALLAIPLLLGCHVFDPPPPELTADAGSDPGTAPDAGARPEADAATDAAEPVIGDSCTAPVTVLPDPEPVPISLADLGDNVSGLASCGGDALDGVDGFVAIDAAAGEHWYVAARPHGDLDVALFVMPSCDVDSCQLLTDACGSGTAEGLGFVPRTAGQYMIGINGRGPDPIVDLTVTRTTCGDGRLEPGEGCDDGNLYDFDGCDQGCRLELRTGGAEREPNNASASANVLFGAGRRQRPHRISGRLGGVCDTDTFAVSVREGATIEAVVRSAADVPCASDHPVVELALIEADSGVVRGLATSGGAGGSCPSFEDDSATNRDLPAGDYLLVLSGVPDVAEFDYRLEVRVSGGRGHR